MFDVLKKVITSFMDVKINKGYGVSTDETLILDEEQANRTMRPTSPTSCKYKLNDKAGAFEFDGMVRMRTGVNMYKVKHVTTGTQLVLPKHLFTLLFDKI